MSKHTLGPWSIDQNAMEHWMITADDSEHHRGYVAVLAATNTQSEANARLIAAAPAMFEALEMVAAWDDDPVGNTLNIDTIRAGHQSREGGNMSDTPRTDSYVYKFPGCQREPRLIDFARQLERELAEMRAEIDYFQTLIESMKCCQNCDNLGGRASRCGDCVRLMFVPDADSIDNWVPIKEEKKP
jgi:hypothetical protein